MSPAPRRKPQLRAGQFMLRVPFHFFSSSQAEKVLGYTSRGERTVSRGFPRLGVVPENWRRTVPADMWADLPDDVRDEYEELRVRARRMDSDIYPRFHLKLGNGAPDPTDLGYTIFPAELHVDRDEHEAPDFGKKELMDWRDAEVRRIANELTEADPNSSLT